MNGKDRILLNYAKLLGGNGKKPTGTIEILENGNYDVTNYAEANVNIPINPPNWNEIGYNETPQSIIEGFEYAKDIFDNWDNTINTMQAKYSNNSELVYFPLVDTSNVTTFGMCFNNCVNLIEIPILNTSNATILINMFRGSSNFSKKTLDNILVMCINATKYTGTKTLYSIGCYSYTSSMIQSLPHYQDFINAGWSLGY